MDRNEALELLRAGSQRERLSAARFLARLADEQDLPVLRASLRAERIPWIRSALETATARAAAAPSGQATQDETVVPLASDDALANEVWARATEELTDRFVHEIRPLLGLARLHASRELPDFAGSKTAVALEQIRSVLNAIDTLGQAAAAPKVTDVDLSKLVEEASSTCATELAAVGVTINEPRLEGPSPLPTVTDPTLLSMAFRNGLRNALEASAKVDEPVTVTWGKSSVELWITVLDFGAGLSSDSAALFALGSSTKPSHLGMGLAIAERAMATLGGEVLLTAGSDGATRFELKCPRMDS
ncbi:MAG: sensor histidine kinase [Mycobacteriales bacterium]